jgi:hypothetical protein
VQTVIQCRYRTGDVCPQAGLYEFDGYVDGCSDELPFADEFEAVVVAGQLFPLIASRRRECFWSFVD